MDQGGHIQESEGGDPGAGQLIIAVADGPHPEAEAMTETGGTGTTRETEDLETTDHTHARDQGTRN